MSKTDAICQYILYSRLASWVEVTRPGMKAEQTSSPALLPFEVNKKRQSKGKGKEGKEGKDGKGERRRTTIREIIEITG